TALSEFSNVRNIGLNAISIDEKDELVAARMTRGKNDIFLCSKEGMAIRFSEEDVRAMGRTARGVAGMNLDPGDEVVALEVLDPVDADGKTPYEILTITQSGYGKRTPVLDYRPQSRGGKGLINLKVTDRTGPVVGARQVLPKD